MKDMKVQVFFLHGQCFAISPEKPGVVGDGGWGGYGKCQQAAVGDFLLKAGLVSVENIKRPPEFVEEQIVPKTTL